MGGVREALVVLIALAIGYGFFLAWKIFSMPREEKNNNFYEPVLSEDNKTPFKEEKNERPIVNPRPKRSSSYVYEPPESQTHTFALLERIDSLEKQLITMRQSILELRGDLTHLTENTSQEIERLRNMQTVSPMYSEAMRLASAGYGAHDIAQRCGIALAEAELVSALARNQEDDYGE